MQDKQAKHFYLTLRSNNQSIVGYSITADPPQLETEGISSPPSSPRIVNPPADAQTFSAVVRAFTSAMESYRRFIPLTLALGPLVSSVLASDKLKSFVKANGSAVLELTSDTRAVFKLPDTCYRELRVHIQEIRALVEGAEHLPEVATIGLISTYDAFLTRLLRVVFGLHPKLVLTSEKTIKFDELSAFGSIEEARSSLIDREIEAVIRLSHHAQFDWMEERFEMVLRKDLPVWPRFVELCERRNLLTHTGGVVSKQYIANCKDHGFDVGEVSVGSQLNVTSQYFSDAVNIVYEIGFKLCHVLWRKFASREREDADTALNEFCYNLIHAGAHELAEVLLFFGTRILKVHSSDRIRRMMVVNLANSLRLQERQVEANKVLEQEDWTAVDKDFAICVAAVRGEITEVIRLMRLIGTEMSAETYRTWPVFRGLGKDEQFSAAFEEVFHEPFIRAVVENREVEIDQMRIEVNEIEASEPRTKKILH